MLNPSVVTLTIFRLEHTLLGNYIDIYISHINPVVKCFLI